jgi:hypothetical protein
MSDFARDPSAGEDRLPWLEAVDDESADEGVSVAKLAALIISALVALGIVIGGVWWLRSRPAPGAAPKDPTLIAAQVGDYKVKPDNPGGMKVEGKGDSAFAASEGSEPNGKIDTNATPEAPVKGVKAKPAEVASKPTANPVVALPKPAGTLVAKPTAVVTRSATPGGRLVQLGAYGSEEKANAGWATLSKRYAYVGALPKTIVAAQVGGSTVYRLRADAGTDAAAICGKLKSAGENCIQVD